MYSISASWPIDESPGVEWPEPADVVREYFRRRVKELGRSAAAERLGTTPKNVDHLKRGRGKISWLQLAAVTDEENSNGLFAALAGVASDLAARGRRAASTTSKKQGADDRAPVLSAHDIEEMLREGEQPAAGAQSPVVHKQGGKLR